MLVDEKMPEKWEKNFMVSIFKGKGDTQNYRNYRGI